MVKQKKYFLVLKKFRGLVSVKFKKLIIYSKPQLQKQKKSIKKNLKSQKKQRLSAKKNNT